MLQEGLLSTSQDYQMLIWNINIDLNYWPKIKTTCSKENSEWASMTYIIYVSSCMYGLQSKDVNLQELKTGTVMMWCIGGYECRHVLQMSQFTCQSNLCSMSQTKSEAGYWDVFCRNKSNWYVPKAMKAS